MSATIWAAAYLAGLVVSYVGWVRVERNLAGDDDMVIPPPALLAALWPLVLAVLTVTIFLVTVVSAWDWIVERREKR